MAGINDPIIIAVVVVVISVIVIAFVELKYVRRSMRKRRARAAKRIEELPDDAHNAIVTAKAIATTLERGGLRSPEADAWIREAQVAYDRQNYRVVLELTGKAKEKLTALKARVSAVGDAAKLESLPPPGPEEPTTKELLQRDFPSHLPQAKFTIEVATFAVDQGRGAGRDVSQAQVLLEQARQRFDGQDYPGALATARLAKRSAEGQPIVIAPTPPASEQGTCRSCGVAVDPSDAFCRKCGARVERDS